MASFCMRECHVNCEVTSGFSADLQRIISSSLFSRFYESKLDEINYRCRSDRLDSLSKKGRRSQKKVKIKRLISIGRLRRVIDNQLV